MDALVSQQMITGGEDRTLRLWKVDEATQLLFQGGHTATVDACSLLHPEAFVSGSQDGSIAYWSARRKRPLAKVPHAHGVAPWGGPCWVSALASLPFSDLAISGSCDGEPAGATRTPLAQRHGGATAAPPPRHHHAPTASPPPHSQASSASGTPARRSGR